MDLQGTWGEAGKNLAQNWLAGTSLVVQCLRIHLPMQGTRV